MEYYNIIILILIFLIVLISFYLIISNLGIKSTDGSNGYIAGEGSNNDLEKKISLLKSELHLIKNKINSSSNEMNNSSEIDNSSQVSNQNNLSSISVPLKNESGSVKEIIIEQDNPVLNTSTLDFTNPNNSSSFNKPPPIIYDPIANYDMAKITDPLVDPRGRTSADQIPTPQVAMQFNFPTQGVLDRYHRIGLLIAIDNNVKKKKSNKIELPYSISDKSNLSSNSDDSDSNSISGTEFVWDGHSKTNINKRKKRFVVMESDNSSSKSYKGIDIKENFENYSDDDDDDSDSIEYFGNTDKSITNVYNVYSGNNDNNILELIGKKITDNWYKYFTSITMGNKIIKVVVRNKNRKELYSGDIIYIPELKRTYRVKIDPMDMIEYNPYFF
jgi:hypothetical protein